MVDDLALGIDLTGQYALVAEIREGPVKPADTCDSIDEVEAHVGKLAARIGERKLSILKIYPED